MVTKKKQQPVTTTLGCSVAHATALRYAAVGLGMDRKTTLERLIEGDQRVRRAVKSEWNRLGGGD